MYYILALVYSCSMQLSYRRQNGLQNSCNDRKQFSHILSYTFVCYKRSIKLQKFACHYNLRKFAFCSRIVNIRNSLPNEVVESNTINTFKNRLDKHWSNQEGLFDFNADLTGTGGQPVCI